MRKKAIAIIGANFGDEGKGQMTDYQASINENPIVIRFNGGAQAGHTVQLELGSRHVFSHFGAGTFTGAPTFLSKFFICNPLLFHKEHQQLIKPKVFVDVNCMVTTPYDMLLNQAQELDRGQFNLGSVGVGIFSTISRHNNFLPLQVKDLLSKKVLRDKVEKIKLHIIPQIPLSQIDIFNICLDDGVFDQFIDACEYFIDNIELVFCDSFLSHNTFSTLIFEGAQGLMLDEDYGIMPHCTPSSCGAKNIATLLSSYSDDLSVELIYMTRSYLTRHGAGPLANEQRIPDIINNLDKTNITNQFQGNLRFANFTDYEVAKLMSRVELDAYHVKRFKAAYTFGITWCNVIQPPKMLQKNAEYLFDGPTRNDII